MDLPLLKLQLAGHLRLGGPSGDGEIFEKVAALRVEDREGEMPACGLESSQTFVFRTHSF